MIGFISYIALFYSIVGFLREIKMNLNVIVSSSLFDIPYLNILLFMDQYIVLYYIIVKLLLSSLVN